MVKRITSGGILTALALIFSYVEALIPLNFGIPGIKLGLANLVVLVGLYFLDWKDVCIISFLRISLAGLLFGSGMSLIFSLSGGILSLAAMIFIKKSRIFSVYGVSVCGGVTHNIGQICAALAVTRTTVVLFYLPVLIIAGVVTGFVMGFIASKLFCIKKIPQNF
ncbi:MAG: Gx transporter family protein [Oscillospiraceae bacterium]